MKAGENIKWIHEGQEVPDGSRCIAYEYRGRDPWFMPKKDRPGDGQPDWSSPGGMVYVTIERKPEDHWYLYELPKPEESFESKFKALALSYRLQGHAGCISCSGAGFGGWGDGDWWAHRCSKCGKEWVAK